MILEHRNNNSAQNTYLDLISRLHLMSSRVLGYSVQLQRSTAVGVV